MGLAEVSAKLHSVPSLMLIVVIATFIASTLVDAADDVDETKYRQVGMLEDIEIERSPDSKIPVDQLYEAAKLSAHENKPVELPLSTAINMKDPSLFDAPPSIGITTNESRPYVKSNQTGASAPASHTSRHVVIPMSASKVVTHPTGKPAPLINVIKPTVKSGIKPISVVIKTTTKAPVVTKIVIKKMSTTTPTSSSNSTNREVLIARYRVTIPIYIPKVMVTAKSKSRKIDPPMEEMFKLQEHQSMVTKPVEVTTTRVKEVYVPRIVPQKVVTDYIETVPGDPLDKSHLGRILERKVEAFDAVNHEPALV